MPGIDLDRKGKVFLIGFFNHSRNTNKVDLLGKRKAAGKG
jgi:uncharacterized protein YuzE